MYEKTQAKCPAMASVIIKECGILNTINREMNLTSIVNDLKTCPKDDKAQQALLWELLKVGSFARVMVTFYSVTMLNTMYVGGNLNRSLSPSSPASKPLTDN
jgi:hypothetical protein